MKNKIRTCIIKVDGKEELATFHEWTTEAYVVEASPMIGGTPGGQISMTYGIVEMQNGEVKLVRPFNITFLNPTELSVKISGEKQ